MSQTIVSAGTRALSPLLTPRCTSGRSRPSCRLAYNRPPRCAHSRPCMQASACTHPDSKPASACALARTRPRCSPPSCDVMGLSGALVRGRVPRCARQPRPFGIANIYSARSIKLVPGTYLSHYTLKSTSDILVRIVTCVRQRCCTTTSLSEVTRKHRRHAFAGCALRSRRGQHSGIGRCGSRTSRRGVSCRCLWLSDEPGSLLEMEHPRPALVENTAN